MTRISYIQGIKAPAVPQNEMADRGKEVSQKPAYIPYLGMTNGEVQLALLREQLKIYAAAYPEDSTFRRGITMVDNALLNGIHNGVNFIGAIPDSLTAVAQLIRQAQDEIQTAGGSLFQVRTLNKGIHVGDDPLVPITTKDCKYLAAVAVGKTYYGSNPSNWPSIKFLEGANPALSVGKAYREFLAECELKKDIEKILNDKLETCSHHVLYKNIPGNYQRIGGTGMNLKRILHNAGVQTLGNVAGVIPNIMSSWTEIGILRNNAKTNAGPIGSIKTGFLVAENGNEEEYKNFVAWLGGTNRDRGDGINIAPAVIAAIIALIGTALTVAAQIVQSINARKTAAMAAAQGFGTIAYSAEPGDMNNGSSSAVDNILSGQNLFPLLAIGAGAYLILNDD